MVEFALEFDLEAEGDLARLERRIAQRILKKLKWLVENIEHLKPEPLHDRFKGKYKLRIGDYRAIYTINRKAKVIRVHLIDHRSQIYRT